MQDYDEAAAQADLVNRPLYTTSFAASPVYQQQSDQTAGLLIPLNLKAMTHTLTKKETLDDKVERALCTLAEDIVDDVIDFACRLAKHRGSNTLERHDVRLAFEKRLKVRVPVKTQTQLSGAGGVSAASTIVNSGAVTASANLPAVISPTPVSTANYKSSLALVKKAQENYLNQQATQH